MRGILRAGACAAGTALPDNRGAGPIIRAHCSPPATPADSHPPPHAQLRTGRRQLRPDRPAEGGRAARRGGHRARNLAAHGFSEVAASRGESAYVVDVGPFYLASIVECLGSKALVADEMQALTGRSYYAGIAQDTIAMAINDLITVGATPLVVQAYWAAGGSDWFGDAQRAQALVAGWKRACDTCGVAWGGGETPALAGIVEAGRIDLAASLHRHRQPEVAPVGGRPSSRPATRSCCWPPAASMPTA